MRDDSSDLGRVKIQAVVTGHEKGKKIHGLKFKPKRGYKRRYGHRQDLTLVRITDILTDAKIKPHVFKASAVSQASQVLFMLL